MEQGKTKYVRVRYSLMIPDNTPLRDVAHVSKRIREHIQTYIHFTEECKGMLFDIDGLEGD